MTEHNIKVVEAPMGTIYQLTFFLALALLAIVTTIFVLAVSLLGRAMEAAARSERGKLLERRESNAKEMEAIKRELEKAEASGQIPKGLAQKLKKLEKRDQKFEKELSKIRKAPQLLTVKGGIVFPAGSLLGALILSGGAWYLTNIQVSAPIPIVIWILSLGTIGYSISLIYQSLRLIENVAVTSEEVALKRETLALKTALREVEEQRKPQLALDFQDKQPPFHVEAGSETFIKFHLALRRGDVARKPVVYLLAPPGFGFPDSPKGPRSTEKYANYVSTGFEFEDITKGILRIKRVKLTTPSQAGHYAAAYKLSCEGFDGGLEEFEIVVE